MLVPEPGDEVRIPSAEPVRRLARICCDGEAQPGPGEHAHQPGLARRRLLIVVDEEPRLGVAERDPRSVVGDDVYRDGELCGVIDPAGRTQRPVVLPGELTEALPVASLRTPLLELDIAERRLPPPQQELGQIDRERVRRRHRPIGGREQRVIEPSQQLPHELDLLRSGQQRWRECPASRRRMSLHDPGGERMDCGDPGAGG